MSKKLDKIILKLTAIEKSVGALLSKRSESRSDRTKTAHHAEAKVTKTNSHGKQKAAAASANRKSRPAQKKKLGDARNDVGAEKKRGRSFKKVSGKHVKEVPLEIVQKGSDGAPDKVIPLDQILD